MKKFLILVLLLNILVPINSYSAKNFGSATIKVAKSNKKVKKSNKSKKSKKSKNGIYFKNCKEAKANGYSNIRKGEPGYSRKLDKDGDGIACETR